MKMLLNRIFTKACKVHLPCFILFVLLSFSSFGQEKLVGMGSYAGGSIFAINEDGSEAERWVNFVQPREPRGSLIESNGKLWGTTYEGGTDGVGTIFNTDLDGSNLQIVMSFDETVTGSKPLGDLLESNGKLWGMANRGGANEFGTIFSIDPDGTNFTVVHDFDETNGSYPTTSLIEADGKLWGTTRTGGVNSFGVIFHLDTDGTNFTKVHDFPETGANTPEGDLGFFNNKIWGTTSRSSILFSIDTDGTNFTTAHTFASGSPSRGFVVSGGKLWGMTYNGGATGDGTIYTFDGTTYTKVHDFDDTNGSFPYHSLIEHDGKLWATTLRGGTTDDGIIFSIDTDGSNFAKLHDFIVSEGNDSRSRLLKSSTGRFIGLASSGGQTGYGTIFSTDLTGGDFQVISDIDQNHIGEEPYGSLTLSNNKLWGMTYGGGLEGSGVIFSLDRDGSNYTKHYDLDFEDAEGLSYPLGSLVESNGRLWGTIAEGGSNGDGAIFSIDLEGTDLTTHHNFNATDGSYPYGSLLESNGKLWGMTYEGGANGDGVIFSMDLDGTNLTVEHDFDGTNGSFPYGGLIENEGKLWGMTAEGGSNDNAGVIFSINTDGTSFTKHHDFNDSDANNGSFPYGNLTLFDGKLWGTTGEGGTEDYGIIFSIDTDGTNFTKVHDFDYYTNGGEAYGTMLAYNNKLIGMTYGGGAYEHGVMFTYDPSATGSEYEVVRDFSGEIGGEPYYGALLVVNTDVTAPEFTSEATQSVPENTSGTIYNAIANESATFSLGSTNDEELFSLTDGDLSFISAPDFETPLDENTDNNYLVEIIATDAAGNNNSQIVTISVTDVNESVLNVGGTQSIQIYPNPSSDFIHIQSQNPVDARVLDLNGKVLHVQSGSQLQIDIRSLKSGMYILQLNNGNTSASHRIIKTN